MAKKKPGNELVKELFGLGEAGPFVIMKNLPFIFFLGFLATIYIANAHYAERKVREIQTVQKELRELRWYYMSLKSEMMYQSKETEVAKLVDPIGIKRYTQKPYVIEKPKSKTNSFFRQTE